MEATKYLYDYFINHLDEGTCLIDLQMLKSYRKIMEQKIEDEDDSDIRESYRHQYKTYIKAEKLKRYISSNIEEYFAINNYELLVKLKSGDKFVYDDYYRCVRFILYENDELTEEQEKREFKRNLRNMLRYKRITQSELAEMVGTTQSMINRFINGKSLPSFMMLRKLSKALDCHIDDLFYKHY